MYDICTPVICKTAFMYIRCNFNQWWRKTVTRISAYNAVAQLRQIQAMSRLLRRWNEWKWIRTVRSDRN